MGRRARRLRGVLEDLHHDARKVRHQTGTGSGGGVPVDKRMWVWPGAGAHMHFIGNTPEKLREV